MDEYLLKGLAMFRTKASLLGSVLLGVAIGWLAAWPQEVPTASAQSSFTNPSGLIAFDNVAPNGVHLLFLIDPVKRVLSIYEYDTRKTKLRLAAVRQFSADHELLEYNNEPPNVENIQKLVGLH